jgi:hypothetical protein
MPGNGDDAGVARELAEQLLGPRAQISSLRCEEFHKDSAVACFDVA